MESLITAISTVGFPIIAALACGWFIYYFCNKNQEAMLAEMNTIREAYQKREEYLFTQIDKFNTVLNNFNATLSSIDNRLGTIEHRVLEDSEQKNLEN